MMEVNALADHDLLITINAKLDVFSSMQQSITAEHSTLAARVTAIERVQDKQAGFLAGGRAVWALLGAIPAGAVLWVLQVKQ